MSEVIKFDTNQELLKPEPELVQEISQLLKGEKKEVKVKLPQLIDLPFSVRLKRALIDTTFSVPSQSVSASIIDDATGQAVPYAGLTATIESDGMTINISSIYSNLTREKGFSGKHQFSGVTALLSTIDEGIAEAVCETYKQDVIRKGQTEAGTVRRLFEMRDFKKVDEASNGKTWWEKKYSYTQKD